MASYENIISFNFKDIDTDIEYICVFDNQKRLWKLKIPGSSDEAVSLEDKKLFYKSEEFKIICKRAGEILINAFKLCKDVIIPKIKKGSFINVDEIKFEAIFDMIKDPSFMDPLKLGKHVH